MHLGRQSVFRRVCFEVDLSAYRAAGWDIAAPRLYFDPTASGDHTLCAKREKIDPDPPLQVDPSGIWKWDSSSSLKASWTSRGSDSAGDGCAVTHHRLEPGEHAVFAYDRCSRSRASSERWRSYRGPFLVCSIEGWRRRWNVSMPNETFAYRDAAAGSTPQRIFYLNVESRPGRERHRHPARRQRRGLSRAFDRREWIYDRISITDMLRGVTVEAVRHGSMREARTCLRVPATRKLGAVRRTYLDISRTGIRLSDQTSSRL